MFVRFLNNGNDFCWSGVDRVPGIGHVVRSGGVRYRVQSVEWINSDDVEVAVGEIANLDAPLAVEPDADRPLLKA